MLYQNDVASCKVPNGKGLLCRACYHRKKSCTDTDTKWLLWCYMFEDKVKLKAKLKKEKLNEKT